MHTLMSLTQSWDNMRLATAIICGVVIVALCLKEWWRRTYDREVEKIRLLRAQQEQEQWRRHHPPVD